MAHSVETDGQKAEQGTPQRIDDSGGGLRGGAAAPGPGHSETTITPDELGLGPLRVLVVEDQPGMLGLMRAMLTRAGVGEVVCIESVEIATALLWQRRFDILFIDQKAWTLDGFDRLGETTRDPTMAGRPIGVILTTSDPSPNRYYAALAAGVEGLIGKPAAVDTLRRVICRYVAVRRPDLRNICAAAGRRPDGSSHCGAN